MLLATFNLACLMPITNPEEARLIGVNLAPNQILAKGTVLGEITAQPGVYAAYNDNNSDGTDTARILLACDAATDGLGRVTWGGAATGGQQGQTHPYAPAWDKGTFDTKDLIGLDAPAVADLGRLVEGTPSEGILLLLGNTFVLQNAAFGAQKMAASARLLTATLLGTTAQGAAMAAQAMAASARMPVGALLGGASLPAGKMAASALSYPGTLKGGARLPAGKMAATARMPTAAMTGTFVLPYYSYRNAGSGAFTETTVLTDGSTGDTTTYLTFDNTSAAFNIRVYLPGTTLVANFYWTREFLMSIGFAATVQLFSSDDPNNLTKHTHFSVSENYLSGFQTVSHAVNATYASERIWLFRLSSGGPANAGDSLKIGDLRLKDSGGNTL